MQQHPRESFTPSRRISYELCKVLLNLGGDVTIQSFPFGTICYLDPSGTHDIKPSHIPSPRNPQRTRRDVPRARGSCGAQKANVRRDTDSSSFSSFPFATLKLSKR